MKSKEFDRKLDQYADVLIRVGLNLQPGQRLLIGRGSAGVPFEAAPFVRRLVAKAYQAGARTVEVLWDDPELVLVQLAHASPESLDEAPGWRHALTVEYGRRGDALLTLAVPYPDLLAGQDTALVNRRQQAIFRAAEGAKAIIQGNVTNWLVASLPSAQWAAKVLPDVPEDERMMAMWELLFRLCRIEGKNPVAGWQKHVAGMAARADYLNAKKYKALHYIAPGTNLKVGLPDGHVWISAGITAQNGVAFTANVPTEEIFTLGHRERVDGVVTSTRPLNIGGAQIEGFRLTFADGRVVRAEADQGGEVLDGLLDMDEGARRIGEVALVPHSSPISQSGCVFHNTLFDENASDHFALGSAYRFSVAGGEAMTDAEFLASGGNQSLIHIDFMVGCAEMAIEGILPDGRVEPVMQGGEWAFEV